MSGARVTFENTRFVYPEGIWSLAVPSLRLGGERVVCIVGPNGSGKSTLLRLAAGILPPSAGCIRLDDRPLAAMPRRVIARRIAFLPQEDPPLFDYTVEAVVRMGRYAHVGWTGALTPTDAMAVREALTAVDLAALRNRPLSRLSGGERRRTMIASVLAQQPRLLLLDEPTSSLDIHHAVAVMRLLADFGPHGPAVALVTHDINLAALFGDRLLLMRNGGIYADGTPREVVRADIMRQVYGEDLLVREHPETGGPMIVPRRTAVASGSDAHV